MKYKIFFMGGQKPRSGGPQKVKSCPEQRRIKITKPESQKPVGLKSNALSPVSQWRAVSECRASEPVKKIFTKIEETFSELQGYV